MQDPKVLESNLLGPTYSIFIEIPLAVKYSEH